MYVCCRCSQNADHAVSGGRLPMPSLGYDFLFTGAGRSLCPCGTWMWSLVDHLLMAIEGGRLPFLDMAIVLDVPFTLGLWSGRTAFQWLGDRVGGGYR